MGWLSRSCSRCVGDSQMKICFLLLALVLSGSGYAGTVAYKFNGLNVTREGGQTYLRGTSPSEMAAAGVAVAAQALTGTGTVAFGSGSATFGASAPIGSAAANVLKTAVRATPGIAGVAITGWLLSKGLEFVGSELMKNEETSNPVTGHFYHGHNLQAGPFSTPQAACDNFRTTATVYPSVIARWGESGFENGCYRSSDSTGPLTTLYGQAAPCPDGTTRQGSMCVGTAKRRATEADLAELGPPTDAAYKEGLEKGVKLPVDKVQSSPQHKDIPLGDPVVDPVTGKRFQDVARVTPNSDGTTANVQVTKVEVDASGNVVTNPDGSPQPPVEQKDPCVTNPDASGCKPLDEVEDVELQKKENPFSLNPISGFGPDSASCPAPQQLFVRGGQSIAWDWGQICTFAQGMRPLVIGFAWLTAIMIVVAVGRRAG